jgi:flagellar biosynthesis protein FlhG
MRGRNVLALDADFGLANLDILLNLSPKKNLGHMLRGEARPEEIVQEAAPRFHVIPGASGLERLADLDPADRSRVVEGLLPLAAGQDYLLIDTSAGIGRNVVDLCFAAREVILVTDPQPTSLTDAYGLTKILLGRLPDAEIRLLVNSTSGDEEGLAVWDKLNQVIERFLGRGVSYLGNIVRDDFVTRATSRQQPFVTAFPRCRASLCVGRIADALEGGEAKPETGIGGFWNRLLSGGGNP